MPQSKILAFPHVFDPTILREYDIRGVFGQTLHQADAYTLGRVFGQRVREYAKSTINPTVVVGYDGRLSSPALVASLEEGLIDAGIEVIQVGCGPTPMVSFGHYFFDTLGAIMVTGSHNPGHHNGFKLTLGKKPFYGADIKALQEGVRAISPAKRGSKKDYNLEQAYVARLLEGRVFPHKKIVWDTGNGAAGEIVAHLIQNLPGEHILLNQAIDGTFPNHHPDPTVAKNMGQLQEAVLQHQAHAGFAFDGDGDRLGVVDEKGQILWGDQILMFLAHGLLKDHPGSTIIGDVKASQLLFDAVAQWGGVPLMERTGHSLIKTKMIETKAPLAGEMSGHIFFSDEYYGFDDAIYGALRFLEYMGRDPHPLSHFYEQFPRTFATPEIRLDCPEPIDKVQVVQALKDVLHQQGIAFNDLDGVRVSDQAGWWGLRASNTQEALTLRLEALNPQDLDQMCLDLRTLLETLGVIWPEEAN